MRQLKFAVFVPLLLALVACAGSPVQVAQTAEQKAYALYGTFVIVEEQAVKLTAPTSTLSPSVKAPIINAVQKAQPIVDSMMTAEMKAETARADFDAKKIDQPAFQIVVESLGSWIAQAEPLVMTLVAAVKGAQK